MKTGIAWPLRLIPAIIVGQTLPFKFSGAEQPVKLFTQLAENTIGKPELEGPMRIGTGVFELIAIVLFLIPKHSLKGAYLTAASMLGALASHALFIGFSGHGPLPAMAGVALIFAALYIILSRKTAEAMG